MSLDDIWDAPIASPPKSTSINDDDSSPLKRPRQSLFLSDNDSDYERPPKRATPAPAAASARPDVDALFEDLDKDAEDDDLRYRPLAPALDLAKLAKEAEMRHACGRQTASSQTTAGGSKANTGNKDQPGKDEDKGKSEDGEKKGRKVLLKLDEERLVGPEGFPMLIKDIKGFKPGEKGNEHADLNRLMQVYQFWTHRLYPKMSFKDTVGRVEKLCHTKRMQVRLSVWRDEFKGVTNAKNMDDDDSGVIDLTEPTLVAAEDDDDDKESEVPRLKSDGASSRTASLPPLSSEVEDDDFDIDAVIRAEEERLASLRGTADVGPVHASQLPRAPEKALSQNVPGANAMDVDETSLWETFDDPLLDPPLSGPPSSVPRVDEENMWDIVEEIEQEQRQDTVAKTQIPIPLSGVNSMHSLESANSANVSHATNDDDWDEMYS